MTFKTYLYILLTILLFASCEEDFNIVTDYKDQTVVYAFLEHKDPWNPNLDTNFIVVNKAFLGEKNIYQMAAVADSVNYPDYNEVEVSLQRVASDSINASPIGDPIILSYTKHYKEPGVFATDNNIVFYTTKALLPYQNTNLNPRPQEEKYYYKLTVKKPNQEEVYAVTEVLRGIYEERPMSNPRKHRVIQMSFPIPHKKYEVKFQTNPGARMFQVGIRIYYYEKRTDGNIYIDYVDYNHHPLISSSINISSPEDMLVGISPNAFYGSLASQLADTNGVVWRIIKSKQTASRPETHSIAITLGTQETYIYNQITQPSYGIVQQKPTYSNITNGLGLFTSKWTHRKNHFSIAPETVDSIALGMVCKNLKFKPYTFSRHQNNVMNHASVIKRY